MSAGYSKEIPEFNSASFDRFVAAHRLMGSRCTACGTLCLPPRPLCPDCYGIHMEWVELSGRGRLAAFTTIYVAPTVMIEAGYGRDRPYCTGIVQLEEGPAISAQILGIEASKPEGIALGMPLRIVFVERGEGTKRRAGLAFQPA